MRIADIEFIFIIWYNLSVKICIKGGKVII